MRFPRPELLLVVALVAACAGTTLGDPASTDGGAEGSVDAADGSDAAEGADAADAGARGDGGDVLDAGDCVGPDEPPTDERIGAACEAYARSICGYLRRCFPDEVWLLADADVPRCLADWRAVCVGFIAPRMLLPDSRMTLADLTCSCAAAADRGDCDSIVYRSLLPPGCWKAGARADGAGCASPFQCASRQCDQPTPGACGTCRAVSDAGGPCEDNGDCRVSPSGALVCENASVCRQLPAVGEPCDGQCNGFVSCVYGTSGGRTCRPRAQLGEACSNVNAGSPICDSRQPIACIDGTCRLKTFVGLGEECGILDTEAPFCARDARCHAEGDLPWRGQCVADEEPAVGSGLGQVAVGCDGPP